MAGLDGLKVVPAASIHVGCHREQIYLQRTIYDDIFQHMALEVCAHAPNARRVRRA